jgi:hypothetical protein
MVFPLYRKNSRKNVGNIGWKFGSYGDFDFV